jgi:hypothetical protein
MNTALEKTYRLSSFCLFYPVVELTPSLGSKIFEQHAHEIGSTPKQIWEHDVSS